MLYDLRLQPNRTAWREHHSSFARALRGVSLITELEVPEATVADITRTLTALCRNEPDWCRQQLQRQSSPLAVLLVHLCGQKYDDATFWPHVWETLQVPGPQRQALQAAFGESFLAALREAELPLFERHGGSSRDRRFLRPILMHTGVPRALMPRWFALIDEGARRVGPDGDLIVEWIRRYADAGSLVHYPRPLTGFVLEGGAFAAAMLTRSLEMLDHLRGGASVAHLGLGAAFEAAAREHVAGTPRAAWRRGVGHGRRAERARIRLRPEEGRIVVELPQVTYDGGSLRWQVKAGDYTTQVTPWRTFWGAEATFAGEDVLLPSPCRNAEVAAVGLDQATVLPVVPTESLPLIAFDATGERLDLTRGLPGEPVWLAAPEGSLHIPGGTHLQDAGQPVGWAAWSITQWDLAEATWVEVRADGSGAALPQTVAVSSRRRAQVSQSAPLAGLRAHGLPVLAERPTVDLPAGDATWRIEVADYASGTTLHVLEVTGGGTVDPFREVAPPVVGAFTINVRGPLGRGTIRSVAVVEGLTAAFDTRLRLFTRNGLDPATATLDLPNGTVEPALVQFDARTRLASAVATAGARSLQLTVEAPSLLTATQQDGAAPSRWSAGPATLVTEDVSKTTLLLGLGHDADPVIQVCRDETVFQVVRPSRRIGSRAVQFPLDAITDTLETSGANMLRLAARADDLAPGVRVATIRPRSLATALDVDGGALRLRNAVSDLEATIWSTGCPQVEPLVRPVAEDGTILLEADDPVAEWVAVSLAVRDDWADPEPPLRFPRRHRFLVSASTLPAAPDNAAARARAAAFAAPAAAGARRPIALPDCSLDLAWSTWLLDFVMPKRQQIAESTRTSIRHSLTQDPARSVSALGGFSLISPVTTAALLQTGLAGAATWNAPIDDETAAAAVRRDPLTGSLRCLPHVIHQRAAYPETTAALVDALGDDVDAFLRDRKDNSERTGRWGEQEDALMLLRSHDPVQYEAVIARLTLRPTGMLHGDARVLASLETRTRMDAYLPKSLVPAAQQLATHVDRSLRAAGFTNAAVALQRRFPDRSKGSTRRHHWVPAASLAWCMALRYGARGGELRTVPARCPAWREAAHAIAPLVAPDLVIAEIHAAHDHPLQEA